jgi:hypothetical protein
MDDDIRDKMFIGVVKYMKDLRTTDVFENEAQRKKYFFYHYNEIMEHFRRELGTHITTIASRPHHEIDKFIKSQ